MRKINRAIHIDLHTMPGIEEFGANFSAAELAETLKDAHVDYVNVFARCNIGFSYYPTKIGIPYPTMKGNLLGDTIRECHKRDIGVTAYINGGLHHELLLKRPEYMRVNKEGKIYKGDRVQNNFFRSPCLNTGYRQYLYEEIKEVMAMEPDGIFLDCVRAESCYCPACIRKMKEQNVDINDDAQVYQFAYDTQLETFREIREIVPKDMRLFFNSFPYDMISGLTSHFEMECLPFSGWWYDYFTVMAPYFRKITSDRVYMTGRFLQSWGDFGGNKTVTSMENDVYDALMYGYAPSVGDHMHPRDGLDRKLYEQIGSIYQYVEELEKWTSGTEAVTEVAILGNKAVPGKLRPSVSDVGAARMLAELKVCYDLVNEDMDYSPYRLLIIPENFVFTDTVLEKLERYEGCIISAGTSIVPDNSVKDDAASDSTVPCGVTTGNITAEAIKPNKIWDYITEYEEDNSKDAFYSFDGETLGQYVPGIRMKSEYSISDYIEPYFERRFDGEHGYFYIPPKDCRGYSAVALKGKRAHICFNIFAAYQQYRAHFHKKLVKSLLDHLLPDRLILAEELPSTARATLMRGANDILHVKVTYPEIRGPVGIIEEHNVLPQGRKISVAGEYQKVCRLPDMVEVKSTVKEGRTEIELPEICGYAPFILMK